MAPSATLFVLRVWLVEQVELELIATNSLEETTNAAIVIAGGNIFIRTDKALWSIGE